MTSHEHPAFPAAPRSAAAIVRRQLPKKVVNPALSSRTGFTAATARDLWARLQPLRGEAPSFAQSPKCYLFEQAIGRLDAFLPILQRLVESGPSLFVAIVTLNLLEVAPRPDQFPFMIAAVKVWLTSHAGDRTFWVDHGTALRPWQLDSAATFTARIDRPGSANDDMRTFVRTFKSHLGAATTFCGNSRLASPPIKYCRAISSACWPPWSPWGSLMHAGSRPR
jgi:hypothetical protein